VKPWKLSRNNEQKIIETYIPKKWEIVYLSEKIGISYGGSSAEEFEIAHPDNKAVFEKAAKVFGDVIIGFDFMIPDITRSWKEQRCGFLEANSVPFINLHHTPHTGKSRNIAAKVWDMIEF
jgi:cyanophycin synthetase